MRRSLAGRLVFLSALLIGGRLLAQIPAFDFYPEFRTWWFALPDGQRSPMEAVIERYQARLQDEGVDRNEIARRVDLIRHRRPELESDFWNRFFTVDAPKFNTDPNAWLVSVLDGRKPGRALDVGMGEGRNTLYLARQGWDVTGFDPAGKAVALAESRAKQQGLKIHTQVSLDKDFDFGRGQGDLILFGWMPLNEPARAVDALRPGGVIVVESPEAW
ncbi:MAG TPA: methyltransferase domain-containing protein [Bryobacteraceae bacterium]|nr:methyltransferase domain-containing protein [Bryobacteraceae bacterium]